MTKEEKFLKLKEVADRLRVHERTVFRYIQGGRLKVTKIGYWRISQKDLTEFLKRNSNSKLVLQKQFRR